MYISTREKIIDYLLNDQKEKLAELLKNDTFAKHVFEEEKNLFQIEMYLDDELSQPEREKIELLVRKNKKMGEEFSLRRGINLFIQELNLLDALKSAWKRYHEQYLQVREEPNRRLFPIVFKNTLKWVAAASIILLLGVSLLLGHNSKNVSSQELFAEYYKPLEKDEEFKLVVNSTALNQAKQNYIDENYPEALTTFRNLPDTLSIITEKNFFMALTMIELDMYQDAINAFQVVIRQEDSECIPQSYWYLSLCYLKTNQEDYAKETLQFIVDNQGYNYIIAGKILKKL